MILLLGLQMLGTTSAAFETDGASPSFTITVGSGTLAPGGTLTVPVTAAGCPGAAGYRFSLAYDTAALQISDITCGAPGTGTFAANLESQPAQAPVVLWYNAEDAALDGVLFYITLQPTDGAAAGDYALTLSYAPGDVCQADYTVLSPEICGGCVALGTGASALAGDLNGSGQINALDVQNLYTYLASSVIEGCYAGEPERYLSLADVNGNGTVDILDYQCLYQLVKDAV